MAEQGGKRFLLQIGNGKAVESATFTAVSDLVTISNHSYVNGDPISFSAVVTTTLDTNTVYYVTNVSGNDFQLAASRGGSALSIDTDGSGTTQEAFKLLGGLRSKSFTLNAEQIDVTNHDSNEWRELLDDAGIRSMSLSGSGVYEDGVEYNRAESRCRANQLTNFRVIINLDGDYYEGAFKIASCEESGEYNAEHTYSLSLESSGEITRNVAA